MKITLLALVGLVAGTIPAAAQDVPVDRWLVASDLDGPVTPESLDTRLRTPEGLAPERLERTGPAFWRLARQDGATALRLADQSGSSAQPILAHTYLRASRDTDARLALTVGCGALDGWLNGQRIATGGSPPGVDRTVRLRGGWNSLLIRLSDASACAGEAGGAVEPLPDPDAEDEALARVEVQASRPPGYRPGVPSGRALVEDVRMAPGLRWNAGSDRLFGYVDVAISSWGRSARSAEQRGEDAAEREPPLVDLTGSWNLRMTSPGGIQRSTAELIMDPDGTLTGALQPVEDDGERQRRRAFSGEIQNGVVSGTEVRFEVRFAAPRGRSTDVEFAGTVTGDSIAGSIRLGQIGDFESRFVAVRTGAPGSEAPAAAAPGARPGADQPSRRVPGLFPGSARTTNENLRARIRRQLTPTVEPPPPAPDAVSVKVDVGGHDLELRASGLEPGVRVVRRLPVPLRRIRGAWRDERVEVEWEYVDGEGDRFEPEAELPFDGVVGDDTPQEPIDLGGWTRAGERSTGRFEIPDALDGSVIEIVSPDGAEWLVDGSAPARLNGDWLLCDPCRGGQRLQIEVPAIADSATLPQVRSRQVNRSD